MLCMHGARLAESYRIYTVELGGTLNSYLGAKPGAKPGRTTCNGHPVGEVPDPDFGRNLCT